MSRRSRTRPPAPQVAVAVPMAPDRLWRLLIGGFLLLGLVAGLVWALAADLPRRAAEALATASAEAGFVVAQVRLEGVANQPRLDVYEAVLDGGSDSMLTLDLRAIRARLLALPWVKDAEVRRRWPDRLEVRLLERAPAALWQHQGRMRLIDSEGVVLPAPDLRPFAKLPLLVGADAPAHAPQLLKLLADHPPIAGRLTAAILVGGRRWDLRMVSGETIALPEGEAATTALMRFVDLDRDTPLLGRGFRRFDLRVPDRMIVRVETETGQLPRPRLAPPPSAAPAPPGAAAGPVGGLPVERVRPHAGQGVA
jgi:cell division protein FtsQ